MLLEKKKENNFGTPTMRTTTLSKDDDVF